MHDKAPYKYTKLYRYLKNGEIMRLEDEMFFKTLAIIPLEDFKGFRRTIDKGNGRSKL